MKIVYNRCPMARKKNGFVELRSLKDQVYHYLREEFARGALAPGAQIEMITLSGKLGISRTPLRDALIRLEGEGFVTISSRRGVFVNSLTLENVREIYQVLGGLEGAAVMTSQPFWKPQHTRKMEELNQKMEEALGRDDFEGYHHNNLLFHGVYLTLAKNPLLLNLVENLKKRLYDFPRPPVWLKDWESASVKEHSSLVELLGEGRFEEGARHLREVHWGFPYQEANIRRYYGYLWKELH